MSEKHLGSELSSIKTENGETSVIAFRATGVVDGKYENDFYHSFPGNWNNCSCFRIDNNILVQWEDIEYNYGDCFDGAVFNAPVDGLYIFYATAFHNSYIDGKICLKENYEDAAVTYQCSANENSLCSSGITLQATLDLDKDDTVTIEMTGEFKYLDDHFKTYYEGRLLTSHSNTK